MSHSVCVLTTVHSPFDQRIFHKECCSLLAAGYKVTLVAQYERREDRRDGIRILGLPVTRSRLGRPLNWLRAVLLAWRERADVYHFHDPELLPWGVVIRWTTGRPVIYDVHEHYPDTILIREWIPRPLRTLVSCVFDVLEKALSRWLDVIIVADEDVERRFQPTAKRVVLLSNFPLKEVFTAIEVPSIASLPSPRPVQIVHVGGLESERGMWLMLDAFSLLVGEFGLDAGLWLAGRISYEGDRYRFEQRIEGDTLVAGRVNWLGQLPHKQLPALLREASIGWAPWQPAAKFHKNVPTKMFEYMACGLPVVGSDLPPIRRFLEAAQAGLLAIPDDPHSHAKQIVYLAQHPEEAQQMGQNGRRAFEMSYNWDHEAVKLVALYESLTDNVAEIG